MYHTSVGFYVLLCMIFISVDEAPSKLLTMVRKQFFLLTALFAVMVIAYSWFLESLFPESFLTLEGIRSQRFESQSEAGRHASSEDSTESLTLRRRTELGPLGHKNRTNFKDNIVWLHSATDSQETFFLKSITETLDERSFYKNTSSHQVGKEKYIHISLDKYFYLKKVTLAPAFRDKLSHQEEAMFANPNRLAPWMQEYQPPTPLADSSNVCKEFSPFLLILVLSVPSSRQSRMAIRQTWGSVAVSQRWPHTPLNAKVKVLFVLGYQDVSPSLTEVMLAERFLYDDILLLDMVEGYNKLTLKMLAALRWTESHCSGVQFVLKADEDSFINIPFLVDFLLVHRSELSRSVFGNMYSSPGVWRGGKWSVSYMEYPFTNFPSYASGSSYVLAGDAISDLLRATRYFLPVPIEDAFITGILPKAAGITRYHCTAMSMLAEISWAGSLPTVCQYYYTRFAVTDLTAEIFDRMWLAAQINYCNTNGYRGLDFIGDKWTLKRT